MKKLFLMAASMLLLTPSAQADDTHSHHQHHDMHAHHTGHNHLERLGPASVSATHTHEKGDWMFSYKFMHMDMRGNSDGTNGLAPEQISGNIANRFFGMPGQPSTYRIVPTHMTMQMHMLGAMYGLTDKVTLMAMANYIKKDMDHLTYAAMSPSTNIGSFNTQSSGIGDTKLSALIDLYEKDDHSLLVNLGVSLPTGSVTERGTILNPMGMSQNIRLPYSMQLGSGTYDLEPTLTYQLKKDNTTLGAQYKAIIRTGRNDEGYSLGNLYRVDVWAEKQLTQSLSGIFKVGAETEGKIDGIDSSIMGPVQTADPDNYGGERVDVSLGLNKTIDYKQVKNLQLGFDLTVPVFQDLNGPQLERAWGATLVLRKTF